MPSRRSAKKRILIVSASFGGGRGSAAEVLSRYLHAHHAGAVEVESIDFLDMVPNLAVAARFAYKQPGDFFPSGAGTFDDMAARFPGNPVVHEILLGGSARLSAKVAEYNPAAVVTTFPLALALLGDKKGPVTAAVFTDLTLHHSWVVASADLFFAPSREMREDLVVRGVPWDRVVVSGIPVAEQFAEPMTQSAARKELGLADRFTVVISPAPGEADEAKETASHLASAGTQVLVDASQDPRLKRRMDALAKKESLVRSFGLTADSRRMIRAADLFVGSAGGWAFRESVASGLPVVIQSAVPGQELHNVDYLVNCGSGMQARNQEDVVEKVRFLSAHPARLTEMAGNAGALAKPAGAQVVCERLIASLR